MSVFHMCLLAALSVVPAESNSFLINRESAFKNSLTKGGLQRDLNNAMGEALGCGGDVDREEIAKFEKGLSPLWRTLPKNEEGNVERRSLRYAIHRYFNRRSAIHIRGFEPSRAPNATGWGSDDILGQQVPAFVESVLESKHKLLKGFTLTDAAHMVATIEQLIFDWEGALLERVYWDQGKLMTRSMGYHGLVRLLEAYVVYWLLRADADSVSALLSNRSLLEHSVPHWGQVSNYIRGKIRDLEYARRVAPVASARVGAAREGHNAFSSQFSFEDAHRIVGGITQTFASFWDSECSSMKATLFEMDAHRTGRVPLSKFYGTGLEADWRFGESEAYLRELGALDESSWRGKQVIISNYMQAASNCVISTPHYLVCCLNDCEPLLAEIELAIGGPSADPKVLLGVVSGMAAQSTLDDDFPPKLKGSLSQQLEQIAAANSGEVPLHGRLFAQWLHYAFPRECAFPHKVGAVASITPSEYGEDFYASPEEMLKHANTTSIPTSIGKDDAQWMSQWSPEEELIAEHSIGMWAPWERRGRSFGVIAAVGGLAVFLAASVLRVVPSICPSKKAVAGMELPFAGKQHYV